MLTWRNRSSKRLHHFQARQVFIRTEPPVAVQIDGEDLGETPLTAEIVPGGVQLIVGRRYRENPDDGGFRVDLRLDQLRPRRRR
jgi:diacylglycerol kinase family enzyme